MSEVMRVRELLEDVLSNIGTADGLLYLYDTNQGLCKEDDDLRDFTKEFKVVLEGAFNALEIAQKRIEAFLNDLTGEVAQ
jgi:hypothetical protein